MELFGGRLAGNKAVCRALSQSSVGVPERRHGRRMGGGFGGDQLDADSQAAGLVVSWEICCCALQAQALRNRQVVQRKDEVQE
jgi:xanthine dehydrogenase molybdopterin-binding subunit B